jgi:hypothetical protein
MAIDDGVAVLLTREMAPRRNTIAEFIAYGNEKLQRPEQRRTIVLAGCGGGIRGAAQRQPPRSKRVVEVRAGSPRAAAEWASTATAGERFAIRFSTACHITSLRGCKDARRPEARDLPWRRFQNYSEIGECDLGG